MMVDSTTYPINYLQKKTQDTTTMNYAETIRDRLRRSAAVAKQNKDEILLSDTWSDGQCTLETSIRSFERWNHPILNRIEDGEYQRLAIFLDGSSLRIYKVTRLENHHKRLYYRIEL